MQESEVFKQKEEDVAFVVFASLGEAAIDDVRVLTYGRNDYLHVIIFDDQARETVPGLLKLLILLFYILYVREVPLSCYFIDNVFDCQFPRFFKSYLCIALSGYKVSPVDQGLN